MFNNNNDILDELQEQKKSHLKMVAELGSMGSSIRDIQKMLTKVFQTQTNENIVLQPYANPFYSQGYAYNSLYIGDSAVADAAKLVIDGSYPSYTITLVAGENKVNIPDGATIRVTTTSGNPVTAVLTRYNNV